MKTPKQIIQELVERVQAEKIFHGKLIKRKPGEIIQELGPVKRQVLKSLKSDDLNNVRWLE